MPGCRRPKPLPPSPRMLEVVAFVKSFTERNGFPPATTDMAAALKLDRIWCLRLATAAVDRGALEYDPGVARSWRLPAAADAARARKG